MTELEKMCSEVFSWLVQMSWGVNVIPPILVLLFTATSSLDASQACCCPPQVKKRHTYSVTEQWWSENF